MLRTAHDSRSTMPASPATTHVALSIVSTLYHSARFLPRFVDECRAALEAAGIADKVSVYEIS